MLIDSSLLALRVHPRPQGFFALEQLSRPPTRAVARVRAAPSAFQGNLHLILRHQIQNCRRDPPVGEHNPQAVTLPTQAQPPGGVHPKAGWNRYPWQTFFENPLDLPLAGAGLVPDADDASTQGVTASLSSAGC